MFDDDQNFSKASFSFFFNYFLQPIFRDLLKNIWSRVENQGQKMAMSQIISCVMFLKLL